VTTDQIIAFVEGRPFTPFTLLLVDGRELHVLHPELINLGLFAAYVAIVLPTSQVEIIDTSMIVSIRTIHPVDPTAFMQDQAE
jgi:hypothetical protein